MVGEDRRVGGETGREDWKIMWYEGKERRNVHAGHCVHCSFII